MGHAQKGDVQSAAIVKVKLGRLVDNRLRVAGGAEIEAACGNTAQNAWLGGQGHQINGLLFIGDIGDAFRHADAKIDDAVRQNFKCGAAGDQSLRSDSGIAGMDCSGTRISPLNAGL